MPTILEVAEKAGVSTTTVSHVINKTRYVSEEVTGRVLQAMDELGYQPNALARSLRRGETNTLGLILPDSANPFFAEISRVIEGAAFQRGYNVVLCNTEGDPRKETIYADVLSQKQVDGMIFVATGEQSESVQTIQRQRLPLVLIDRQIDLAKADTVLTDNRQGGMLAARHLIEYSHQIIGCITGPSHVTPSAERVTGFRQTLEQNGRVLSADLIERGDFSPESGYQAAMKLLQRNPRPTALFVCNDMMAIGAYRAAHEMHLQIPGDLSVVGFDDIELSSYLIPPLTTIAQPKTEIGQAAVDLLIQRIANRNQPTRQMILPTRLVVRQSCGGTHE